MSDPQIVLDNVEQREISKVAALDIGSNSFHLVVARIIADSVQILHKVKQRVRLAEGLGEDNVLADEVMQRGLDTLKVIAESLHGFEPDSVRVVATFTLRKASNAQDFLKAAKQVFPYPIEIISGTEEARLIYSGVAHTNHGEGKRLIVDIGGGSTEFVIGQGMDPKLLRSIQMGCVSYSRQFFTKGELKAKAFNKAITTAQQALELIDEKYCKLGWKTCIGTSGTVKTIITLVQQHIHDGSNGPITLADLEALIALCCQSGNLEDLQLEGLSEQRRGVFAGGLAILTAIFKSLNITEMEYSPAALREGVIYEMEEELTRSDIRQRTAESLATRYDVDIEHARRVHLTSMDLYKQCAKEWKINNKEFKAMLGWAAMLHEVGLQINSRGVQRHSGYILRNVEMPGFNQEQQTLLSVLTGFHRKKIRLLEMPVFSQFSQEKVHRLLALLRLAVLLNIKRQDDILPEFTLTTQSSEIDINFPQGWLENKPIFSADLEREAELLRVLDLKLSYQ